MSELSELFERDPLSLSTNDIAKIIERMRLAQAQYELGVKVPVAPRTKVPSKKAADLLKDLDIE